MNAAVINRALVKRHARDVYVDECNLGSAHRGARRADAWVLRTTWSPLTSIVYEIKVTRADFLNDQKWPLYRDYCHELYFACPWGLIDKQELPENVGLLYVEKGGRAICKRKAVRNEPDPERLLQVLAYVAMSRSTIVANMFQVGSDPNKDPHEARVERIAKWRQWAETKRDGFQVGLKVRGRIGETLREQHSLLRTLEDVAMHMRDHGLDPSEPSSSWKFHNELEKLGHRIPAGLDAVIVRLTRELENLKQVINNIRSERPSGE